MGVLPDWQIERDVTIEPFAASAVRPGVISYGVSSYGYDVRVGRRFKVFTNAHCAVVDPKHFDPASFVDIEVTFASFRRTVSPWPRRSNTWRSRVISSQFVGQKHLRALRDYM